jgi:hypothetical protein
MSPENAMQDRFDAYDDATNAIADENTRLKEALEWYGENARLCRLIHSGGDAGRQALAADGGARARAVLDKS